MSAFTGPNIVEDGLVLMLDVANGESFRGEPTTNLANTDFARTIQLHRTDVYNNAATISDAPEKGIGWKKITITNRGSNFRIAQLPYITHPINTTRTYSIEVDFGITSGYFVAIDGFNGFSVPNNNTNGRKERTVTTTSNSGTLAMFIYHNTSGVSGLNDVIYYRFYQVEDKAYATPFTEGTRGTTVATGGGWADLSGNSNHGELVNGPTYSSSNLGSLVFDGVDDRTISPSNVVYGNNTTWSAFVNRDQSVNEYNMFMGRFLPYFAFRSNNQIHFSNRISDTQRNVYSATSDFQNNIWYGFTFTTEYDGTNTIMKIYINGVFNNSGTFSGSQSNDAYRFTVGDGRNTSTWYPFKGKVSNVTVYNRTLTPAEILQNYNATKGRFGQ